ncbi:MAG: ATP-binding protein [Candidatus Ozemobacteraceae bacterium]
MSEIEDMKKKVRDLEIRCQELDHKNKSIAMANARLADLFAELELKDEQVKILNQALARANARAAEFLAELELSQEKLEHLNALLKSEKKRLFITLRSIGDGVIVTDTKGTIEMFNGAAEALTGWTQDEVKGKDIGELLQCGSDNSNGPDIEPDIIGIFLKEKRDGFIGETWLPTKNGERKAIEVSIAMVKDFSGELSGAVYVFRDRTEQKEVERLKEEFLSSMNHDLKSPLGAIRGFIDLLEDSEYGEISEEKLDFVQMMKNLIAILLDLINNILENSRISSGRMSYQRVDFSLPELISEIKETFRPQAILGGIALDFSSENNLFVHGDHQRIRQIFHNLVGNAIRFTPIAGTVSIKAMMKNNRVNIEVADTGEGIPESEHGKLFQRFCTIKGARRGTGLGLFNVKTFLKDHESEICFESKPGKGTRFSFDLPLGKRPE